MKRSILGLALLAGMAQAYAQPKLVKDINPGTAQSYPSRITAMGNKLVFAANDGTNGNELWMMDSNANLVYNINPAAASGINTTANYRPMATVGKYIYFPANNGTSGTELFRWDGVNMPMLAADVWLGTSSSGVDEVVAHNGKIYFDANDGTFGEELWVYDTLSNTATRLTDINTFGSSNITGITAYKDKIYFSAFNNTYGTEVWSYTPATNSTSPTPVLDIESGVNSSSPNNFMVAGNKLYFTATTFANGRELYSLDSNATIARISDVISGSGNGIPATTVGTPIMGWLANTLYFTGNDATSTGHLYKYSPATGIVSLVYKTNATGNSNISNIFTTKNKLYFSADNGTAGSELWMYNGSATPSMVADIYTGAIGSFPSDFALIGKNLYFRGADSANSYELFSLTDSTLSVQNIAFKAAVKVYPNPTNSNAVMDITLENNMALSVSLTDMTGKTVHNSNTVNYPSGKNTITLQVADMPAGIYVYTIKDENGRMMAYGRLAKQ